MLFRSTLLSTQSLIDELPAGEWLEQLVEELAGLDNVIMLPRTTVFGYFDHNFLCLAERCSEHLAERQHDTVRQRLWRVRARQAVLAQGACERPLVFCNNDRPGVMLASAVSSYINRYAVCPGKRAVVFTNNDAAYGTALDLHSAGASVVDRKSTSLNSSHSQQSRMPSSA